MTLKIFVSQRSDGSMKSVHGSNSVGVSQSQAVFLQKNDIDPENTTLVRLRYEGNDYTRYFTVDEACEGDGITRESTLISDALVVTELNHALFLPLADCIGAVLYDPTKNILMVSHLGRHNLEQYGGTKSVDYLIKHHNIDPKNLIVWLSPAAGQESYPVFAFNNRSLHDVATEQLMSAGVLLKNIEVSSIDTAKDQDYYSHSQFLKGDRAEDGRFSIVAYMTN